MSVYKCPNCGNNLVRKINVNQKKNLHFGNVIKRVHLKGLTYEYCSNCKEEYYNKKDWENYTRVIEIALQEGWVTR